MLKLYNNFAVKSALGLIVALGFVACGQLKVKESSGKEPGKEEFFIRVKAQTPKPRNLQGFPPGQFPSVEQERRCQALESFVEAYHREYLQGLDLDPIAGSCSQGLQNETESNQLDITLSRTPEALSFRIQVFAAPTGAFSLKFNKLRGEDLLPWNPKSEEFIMHVNMSHIEATLASWIGVD
jgi:hypothetical protein